jgi:hypothetical protein
VDFQPERFVFKVPEGGPRLFWLDEGQFARLEAHLPGAITKAPTVRMHIQTLAEK